MKPKVKIRQPEVKPVPSKGECKTHGPLEQNFMSIFLHGKEEARWCAQCYADFITKNIGNCLPR